MQELYDKQVKFQARYLFSAPVDEDKPEVYGMAEAVLRWRGIRHLRADLESQLERLQELAARFLAEREASRRQSEARRSAVRQWLFYGTLAVLGVVIAGGDFAFSLLAEAERLPGIGE